MANITNVQDIKDFIKKEWELRNHHKFVEASVEEHIHVLIDPHLICKATNCIEADESLNDTLQYWVEVLIPYKIDRSTSDAYHYPEGKKFGLMHDTDLDCGGYTYEEAILKAHELMTKKYGATSEALHYMRLNQLFKEQSK